MTASDTPSAGTETPAHATSVRDLLNRLGSSDKGLSAAEARQRLETDGPNELAAEKTTPWWVKLLLQFKDVMVGILIVAAVVALLFHEYIDAGAIAAIVVLNALLGFIQEYRAERALLALRQLASPEARVRREGSTTNVPARELVAGDVVELEAGDRVSADARLIEAYALRADEAALTGESVPADKHAADALPRDTSLADRENMLYSGTLVVAGQATAIVTGTGMRTEIGHIAGLLSETSQDSTPLQKQWARLGRMLAILCLLLVAVILALQLWRGTGWRESFFLAIGLAVAAVPEGLPAVVTVSLALGLQRLAKRNALVRRLPSVETLGSVTVICSDKTGTLTRNEMTVKAAQTAGAAYAFEGIGYQPEGHAVRDEKPIENGTETERELALLLEVAARCGHAKLEPPEGEKTKWSIVGDPTEAAMHVAAYKLGVNLDEDWQVLHETPFDSQRKAMSQVVKRPDGTVWLLAKGAPDVILPWSEAEYQGGESQPLDEKRRKFWLDQNDELAGQALRVLACAYRVVPEGQTDWGQLGDEGLTFLGLIGMIDPPRDEARDAVKVCRGAGIRPVMITGDHPRTALAIARDLGISMEGDKLLAGKDLVGLDDDQLKAEVKSIAVYARMTAEHKLRVVRAWQSHGAVVAMTGDGVNDAPAVKQADIGVAMGKTGTDVTRETSDMILLDDNFATIVAAVEEGRTIYDNLQKFLSYLLSCNAGEVLLMLGASLLGWVSPLTPVQLLWINLVTDGLPALALALEPAEPGVMERPPRESGRSMLSWSLGGWVLFQGTLLAGIGLFAFWYASDGSPESLRRARTLTFATLVFDELFRVMAARSRYLNIFQLGLFTNKALIGAVLLSAALQAVVLLVPPVRTVFGLATLSGSDWLVMLLLALIPVSMLELVKLVMPAPEKARLPGAEAPATE